MILYPPLVFCTEKENLGGGGCVFVVVSCCCGGCGCCFMLLLLLLLLFALFRSGVRQPGRAVDFGVWWIHWIRKSSWKLLLV